MFEFAFQALGVILISKTSITDLRVIIEFTLFIIMICLYEF